MIKLFFLIFSALLKRVSQMSKTEFRLQFEGFDRKNFECDADRVVGEILSGILSDM